MEVIGRLAILKRWYELYDEFMAGMDMICEKGCDSCCTCNVTCTTLEGVLIYDRLAHGERLGDLNAMFKAAPEGRFQPAITLNQMVEMCVHDLEIPEEAADPGAGSCGWLDQALCSLYQERPFACRAMCSLEHCGVSGEAQMPPLVLTVNNVFMQYIEALDRPGASGNLLDVLIFLSNREDRHAYAGGNHSQFPEPLKANLPFSVLMVPPEHRERIEPLVRNIHQVLKAGA